MVDIITYLEQNDRCVEHLGPSGVIESVDLSDIQGQTFNLHSPILNR